MKDAVQPKGVLQDLMVTAGYQVHAPDAENGATGYYWTLCRNGMSGVDTNENEFPTPDEAWEDALRDFVDEGRRAIEYHSSIADIGKDALGQTHALLQALSDGYPEVAADTRVLSVRQLVSEALAHMPRDLVPDKAAVKWFDGAPYFAAEVSCQDSPWSCSCGASGDSLSSLKPVGTCALTPGDPSPAGRCPSCDALAYPEPTIAQPVG